MSQADSASRADREREATTSERALSGDHFDFERLERAVSALATEHRHLQKDASALRAALAERERRIRELEEQLLDANQRRQDTGKRIDELIAQLDQLDAQLASVEPTG